MVCVCQKRNKHIKKLIIKGDASRKVQCSEKRMEECVDMLWVRIKKNLGKIGHESVSGKQGERRAPSKMEE